MRRAAALGGDMANYVHDDGGRARYFKGDAGDCVTRAIAIATQRDYLQVYGELRAAAQAERPRNGRSRSNPRNGVSKATTRRYMASIGWQWVPTMAIGAGCRVHLRAAELPAGRLVVSVSRHVCAVIDGMIRDTYDPSRGGRRCVYGFFCAPDDYDAHVRPWLDNNAQLR